MQASSNYQRAKRAAALRSSNEKEVLDAGKRANEAKKRELLKEYSAVRRAAMCGISVTEYKKRFRMV